MKSKKYIKGQAWQYKKQQDNEWIDCYLNEKWLEPHWLKGCIFRLHPHNQYIQSFLQGEKIQLFCPAINKMDISVWLEDITPDWNEKNHYRVMT